MRYSFPLAVALIMIVAVVACDETDPFSFQDDFSMVPEPYDTLSVDREVRSNGLVIYRHDEGSGQFTITERDRVFLYYTFRLADGTIVQSTYANNRLEPNEFLISSTIRGFREGVVGLKEGGKVTLVIPPNLGYGGDPQSQFRNDTLYYDILIDRIAE